MQEALKKYKKEVVVISTSENFAEVIENFADKVHLIGDAKKSIYKDEILDQTDDDILKIESTKNYFKAIWALSKNHKNLSQALHNIFNKYSIMTETKNSGLKYIVLETILRYSKHNISDIKQSLYEFLATNKQGLILIMSQDNDILIIQKYAKNFPKKFKEISLSELLLIDTQIAS